MPVYNAQRFLKPAIESILHQTFGDFEFLIINDCSQDNTRNIIDSYNDPRMKVVHNESNLGIAASLNKGIQMASCAIIARMDADDVSHPERLEKQYDFMMRQKDCALLSSYLRVIAENGDVIREEMYRDASIYYSLHFECVICHPSVMFRRQAVLDVNSYTMPYAEDHDLFWKLASRYRIRQLEEILIDYRVSKESTHLVHRKAEYEEAVFDVVKRNIDYYFKTPLALPREYISFLRYEFEPVMRKNRFSELVKCMRLLKKVSKKIISRANPNNIIKNSKRAYAYKRFYTLRCLKPLLPRHKWILLCLLSGEIKILYEIARYKWNNRINNVS